MKKYLFLLFILLILSINNSYGYSLGCSSYGMAIENYNGTCSCMKGYRWGTLGGSDYCISGTSYCYNNFGINSEYDYLSDSCKCRNGYGVSYDFLGNQTCTSYDTLCQNDYGYGAKSTGNGYCGCKSGYIMGQNSLGKKQCNSGYTYCSSNYGIHSSFDSISNSCVCNEGYTVKTDSFGNQTCEEKSNSAYFFLDEYNDDNNKALVISYITKQKYLLELKYTSGLYKAENFIGKSIVINMGTDFNINRYDKFILNNDITTTDIVSDILDVEEVDDNYTLKTCEEVYGENSEETYNNKCICKTGYQWNYSKTSCELIPQINTCADNINGYLGTDGKCYCNFGYYWSDNDYKCIKNSVLIIDKNKEIAEKLFNQIKTKINTISKDKQSNIYSNLLIKIDKLEKNVKGDTLIILNYLKTLINNEINK